MREIGPVVDAARFFFCRSSWEGLDADLAVNASWLTLVGLSMSSILVRGFDKCCCTIETWFPTLTLMISFNFLNNLLYNTIYFYYTFILLQYILSREFSWAQCYINTQGSITDSAMKSTSSSKINLYTSSVWNEPHYIYNDHWLTQEVWRAGSRKVKRALLVFRGAPVRKKSSGTLPHFVHWNHWKGTLEGTSCFISHRGIQKGIFVVFFLTSGHQGGQRSNDCVVMLTCFYEMKTWVLAGKRWSEHPVRAMFKDQDVEGWEKHFRLS